MAFTRAMNSQVEIIKSVEDEIGKMDAKMLKLQEMVARNHSEVKDIIQGIEGGRAREFWK